MEVDGEQNSSSPAVQEPSSNRRKSGRQVRKPTHFAPANNDTSTLSNGSGKRKHVGAGTDNDEDAGESSSEEEDESEPDEEELKEKRRASRNKKPAVKKPKMANGTGTSLAIRPAGAKVSKAAKVQNARSRKSQATQEGLYADVFGRGLTGEAVAAGWLSRYNENNVHAMREMVNFILKCTGCDLTVENADIEDVDNVSSKIGDLQDDYKAANITDFPLVSKLKQFIAFRPVLVEFFDALTHSMHSSSILYSDSALIENIQLWATTMSSASIRPFRHTATIISLTLTTSLCQVAKELLATAAHSRKQMEAEQKKKSVNKGRVGSLKTKIEELDRNLEMVDTLLKDEFDAVFVHRYRDVDPKTRAECVAALGSWMTTYRAMFFEGQYLRYLGWVLSDTVSQTRVEVIKQLLKLFKNKDNVSALRAFTERFRSRLVEMAIRDTEPGVRATTVELLDILRDVGYLEPDDIDAIGQLVFDVEPRVRKAVAKFFVSNIYDVYEGSTEVDGMADDIKEFFPDDEPEDFETPRPAWIKFKSLADVLGLYSGNDGAAQARHERSSDLRGTAAGFDSRYALAAQAIYPHMKELHDWQALAGYLLYDHSQIPETSDAEDTPQSLFKLNEGQETILLEVLDSAVKLHIVEVAESEVDKKGRRTKAKKDEVQERQESIAHSLTQIIPRLLNKFGSVPDAALPVLRLETLLNLDLVQALQQDSATYSSLLDDINKQFMTHSDQSVLAAASQSLLHASSFEELKEATEGKVQELWDDTISTLQNLLQEQNLDTRGTISSRVLTEIDNTILRIANLASISDCITVFETRPSQRASKKKGASKLTETVDPLGLLLELTKRGIPDDDTTEDFVAAEDDLAIQVIRTILFYFMWKIQSITLTLTNGTSISIFDTHFFETLSYRRDSFVDALTAIVVSRKNLDPVRFVAATCLLDLETLFSTLRHVKTPSSPTGDEIATHLRSLVHSIPTDMQSTLSKMHDFAEKSFAKKSHHKLDPSPDDDPVDSDDEDDDEEPSDSEDVIEVDKTAPNEIQQQQLAARKEAKTHVTLSSEQRLCELTGKMVLAIVGQVLDPDGSGKLKAKLLRNRTKLGPNYRDVVAYLDDPKDKISRMQGKKKSTATKPKHVTKEKAGAAKSTALVLPEDDIEDDDDERATVRGGHVEEDDGEALRDGGLVEDEVEDIEAPDEEADGDEQDEDDPMGD